MKKTSVWAYAGGLLLILSISGSTYTVMASEISLQENASQYQVMEGISQNSDLEEETGNANTVNEEEDQGDNAADDVQEDAAVEIAHLEVEVKKSDPKQQEVTLAWEAQEGASTYVLMRGNEDEWLEEDWTEDTGISVSVERLGEAEVYKICAYDAYENLIGESDKLEIAIPGNAGKLSTTSLSKTKVRLYWKESEEATAYRIYVKSGDGSYKLSQTVENPQVRLEVKENENYSFRVVPIFNSEAGAIEGSAVQTAFSNQEMVSLDHKKYTYKEMCADIKALCNKYSEYVSYESIGKSEQGREIYDVILGNPKAQNTILVVSTLHGREYIATAVCMKQLEYYLLNYNKTVDGKKLSEVFDDCNVHYVMMANPDGVTISQNSNARWKGNANGVNLNRNFPYAFRKAGNVRDNSYSGAKAASESETQAIIALTKKLNKKQNLAVVNYHAMGNIVFGDYAGKKASLKNEIKQMYQIARSTTGYADARSYGGDSNGNYREYLIYKLDIPSVTLEMGSVPCPVPQYQYASAFNRNKLVVLREAEWLSKK